MELIRGWERRYTPQETGSVRLSKASVYRTHEGEGTRDEEEGAMRVDYADEIERVGGSRLVVPVDSLYLPNGSTYKMSEPRPVPHRMLAENSDSKTPYILCLSRMPFTFNDWMLIKNSMSQDYDTWTKVSEVDRLKLEIEIGIKRWLTIHGISDHRLSTVFGWVVYTDVAPPLELNETTSEIHLRWFRKNQKYINQREYRFAWILESSQVGDFPEHIDVELTRTGINLFQPWSPPNEQERRPDVRGEGNEMGSI